MGSKEGPLKHFITKLFKHRGELKAYYNRHAYALHPDNCQHSPKCAYKKNVLKWEKSSRKEKPDDNKGRGTQKMSVSRGKGMYKMEEFGFYSQ